MQTTTSEAFKNRIFGKDAQSNSAAFKKAEFNKRFLAMKREYDKWVAAWKQLSQYINPTRGVFNNDRSNLGKMIDHTTLLSGHATQASLIFASGMNSGMTNKSSIWFRPTLEDVRYLEFAGVRDWLDQLQNLLYAILNQSNLYGIFQSTYEELGDFGTGCFGVFADWDDVIRGKSFTIGEYFLAVDNKGRVCAFGREFELTVGQLVKEFGFESCSTDVKSKWLLNQVDDVIKVNHLIEPNDTRSPDMIDFQNMPFRSVYWEAGNTGDDLFLSKSGFRIFPIVAPRWYTTTTSQIYGYGPGWHALGAVKELQKTRLDKLLAQEKMHNPPMLQDANANGHVNILPGGVTKTSLNTPNPGVRPAYQINPNLESFVELMNEEKGEIDRFFFVDLFLMLMNADLGKMTATEVAERQQEKIMMMGPALHRQDEEMLTPTLEIIFGILEDANLIPPAPREIQGMSIKIEYTSILAQAQKALGITKIERVVGYVGQIGMLDPESIDVIDFDESIRQVADMEGAAAKIIRNKDQVEAIRAQRAQQQQMQQAMQGAQVGADAVNKLANSPTGEGSVLDGAVAAMSG